MYISDPQFAKLVHEDRVAQLQVAYEPLLRRKGWLLRRLHTASSPSAISSPRPRTTVATSGSAAISTSAPSASAQRSSARRVNGWSASTTKRVPAPTATR